MKYRMFRLFLFILCLLVVSLVSFNYDPGEDVEAAVYATVELSEYEASYQWAKLTGTLSSTRLVKEVGFRYHIASDFIYVNKFIYFENVFNPFVAFIYLDISGDMEYIAEAYYINTLGQTIYSDPVRITRTVLPECSASVDRIYDTSVHVNLTINTVDNQLSEVKYVLYQDMHHRRTVTLGTDIIDIMSYSFDITGLTPDSEYIFRPSYVLPDGTEIKCESITWKTLETSQVSPTPAPTPTSAPTQPPVPTPTTSLAPTSMPTSASTSTATTAPTPALTPTSAGTGTPAATSTTTAVTEETTTGQTTPGSTTSQATTMGSETKSNTTEQTTAETSGTPTPTTIQTTTDPMNPDEAGGSGGTDRFGRTDPFLLIILIVIAFTVVVIIVLLIIGKIKKVW
ncbi:MAG: hypothetical protein SCM11_09720 [Bacillota bacterium]|nr:hypothetical protein [Bacillota bacterium]